MRLTPQQLTGRDPGALVELHEGQQLLPEVAQAFQALQADAAGAGFDLAIASSYRSYQRQLLIFNGKAGGQRPVHDDLGQPVPMQDLAPREQLLAILRFSALPGTSRHHWGTDLDVFDRAAVPGDYQLQLSPQEVAPGGVFDALHCWLDERMARNDSHGFFRPYARDRGGVAPERWHLSYAPIAADCGDELSPALLQECWDADDELLLRGEVDSALEEILTRFVRVRGDWCPAQYRG